MQVLTRHGDRTSINPLPFETREQWSALLLSDDEQSALAKEAAPFPADAGGLLDARAQALARADGEDASWHGQLTTRGVAQLEHTGSALRARVVGGRRRCAVEPRRRRSDGGGAHPVHGHETHRAVRAGADARHVPDRVESSG